MKSKAYVLKQIRDLQVNKFGHTQDDANTYVETVKGLTVYELLVLKKELVDKEEPEEARELPISTRWLRGHVRFEDDDTATRDDDDVPRVVS